MRIVKNSQRGKKFAGSIVSASVTLAAALGGGGVSAQTTPDLGSAQAYASGRILVMPRSGLPEAALAKILNESGGGKARRVGKSELRIVDLPRGLEKQSVEKLARHPHIEFAELDRFLPPEFVTNDPYLGSQWHVSRVRADIAWDKVQGAGVTIAIIDTGVESSHPDLFSKIVAGWNFFSNTSDTSDPYNHGTGVAGAAAAESNNATGVAGISGQSKIMPIRITDSSGTASLSAMTQAITFAADRGVRVANLSFAAAGSSSVQSAAQYLKSKGGLLFVSAGNYARQETWAPTTSLIAVSGSTSGDQLASWSSYGGFVSLAAPGVGVYTTTRGAGYASESGTSFASPVAAGVAALVMAANPALTSSQVESILFSTAVDLGAAGRDINFGYGRIDAAAAVQKALATTGTTADTQAPVVSIKSPLLSSTLSGLVPVDVSVSDNVGVTRVDFSVNGVTMASDSVAPFAFSWDSTTMANGQASLAVVAVDAAGNKGTSAAVSVNVANAILADTIPPVVVLSNLINGSVVSGTVGIRVGASDNSGTAGLTQKLFIAGKLVASASGGSLSYNWNTRKGTAKGPATIVAVAADGAGNSTSTTAVVTVK